jgi:flagellar protein FlgJ
MTQPIARSTAPAASLGAADISNDSSRLSTRANLVKAGQQFEAVFDGMMLKSMRDAKLSDSLFDSKALDTFRDMQDQQLSQSMAEHAPIGIGKAMVDFLSKSQASLQAPKAPSASVANPASDDLPAIGETP